LDSSDESRLLQTLAGAHVRDRAAHAEDLVISCRTLGSRRRIGVEQGKTLTHHSPWKPGLRSNERVERDTQRKCGVVVRRGPERLGKPSSR
jgi:hypothetical protein